MKKVALTGLVGLLMAFLLSGCASWCEIHRDEEGRVNKIKYSNNQHVIINKDGIDADNKIKPMESLVSVSAIGK